MTFSNTVTQTEKPSCLEELVGAVASIEIELPKKIPDGRLTYFGINHIAKALRNHGLRFPKALVDAIVYLGGNSLDQQLSANLHQWKQILVEFLTANREFLEPVYRTGRFLPPFPISFEDVSSRLQKLFLILAGSAGVKNPGNLIFVSEGKKGSGYTDAVVVLLPVGKHENHLIAATVRRRRWYIPPAKADENFREFRRRVGKALRRFGSEKAKIANETYIMVGRYTGGVRGFFRRKGISKSKQAVLVFDDRKRSWFVLLIRFLRNLFSKRLSRQEESTRNVFGVVAERMRILRAYLNVLGNAESLF